MLRRHLLFGLTALVAILSLVHTGTASADYEPGDTVEAIVTGSTSTDDPPPIDPAPPEERRGGFNDVGIAGVFTAEDGNDVVACPAVVSVGTVEFETTETLLFGTGTIDPASFSGGTNGVCSVDNGSIQDGEFERIGTVAVATLSIHYTITTEDVEEAEGRCRAVVVVTATPNPADLSQAVVVGSVTCQNPAPH